MTTNMLTAFARAMIAAIIMAGCNESSTTPPVRSAPPDHVNVSRGATSKCVPVPGISVSPESSAVVLASGEHQTIDYTASVYVICVGYPTTDYPNATVSWGFSGNGSYSGSSTGTQTASLTINGSTPRGSITVTAGVTHPYDGNYHQATATVYLGHQPESPARR